MGDVLEHDMALSANGATWSNAMRAAYRNSFAERGLPTRRVEAWKYSDLARALKDTVAPHDEAALSPEIEGADVISFRDGLLEAAPSSAPVASFTPLSDTLSDVSSPYADLIGAINPQLQHPIVALNAAEMRDGFVLHVPKGARLESPLHVRFDWRAAGPAAERHVRLVFLIEEGAEATFVESHVGAPHFATVVTEVKMDRGARFDHVRLERLDKNGRLSAATLGEIAEDTRYQAFYISEGGKFARHEAHLKLTGSKAEAALNGACLAAAEAHCDNTIVIAHEAPEASSSQTFRNVLGGRAHGVFQGCVKVARAAQKTNARQLCRSLLLTPNARVSAKPELEIFADDVKCSHGAASGDLDEQALFFLRSRGIPLDEARLMLVDAFLGDSVASIRDPKIRAVAGALVTDWVTRNARDAFDAR